MKKYINWKTATIVLAICVSSYFLITKPIARGLDISGGTHFTIGVMVNDLPKDQRQSAIDQTLAVYRNRLDEIGVAGTTIQQSGEDRIIVQIPGIDTKDAERIKEILKRQAHLEFKLVIEGPGEPIEIN